MNMESPSIQAVASTAPPTRHDFARDLAESGRPTEVLHIGDHDPSGAHIFISLAEDVEAFAEHYDGDIRFTRLAVTPEQIEGLGLPTSPPKEGDKRAFVGETCQPEAIAPDILTQIVRDAVVARLNRAAFNRMLRRERAMHDVLRDRLRTR